jgi:CRISPR-associated protein Cmr4
LKRYKQVTGLDLPVPRPTVEGAYPVKLSKHQSRLFFSLGFLDNLKETPTLSDWVPQGSRIEPDNLVVVADDDIAIIHNMALYRQTRTKLFDDAKKVENFFGFEALPEDSILVFPVAVRKLGDDRKDWDPLDQTVQDLYFGGLESIGCGRASVRLGGEYFTA